MLQDIWTWLTGAVQTLGYGGIFGLMALESSFFPFPSEVVVPPGGANARDGTMSLSIVILMGILGSMAGALFNYWLAVKLGRPVCLAFCRKYGKYILFSEKKFLKSEEFFRRHGELTTFVGRLVPAVRQVISFPAGLARMNLFRFCLFTALGSGIWVVILALVGYYIGRDLEKVKHHSKEILLWMLPAVVLLVVLYVVWDRKWRKRAPEPAGEEGGAEEEP